MSDMDATKSASSSAESDFLAHTEELVSLYDESFHLFNSMISPWHEWLDPVVYNRHVDTVEGLRPEVVASAHGHVLRGGDIHDAFDRVRAMAGQPRVMPPGQSLLDELLATVIAA